MARKKRKTRRKPFWTADCETDPFLHGRLPKPFLWGAYEGDSQTFLEFDTTEEFVRHFEKENTVVYAHNGGKFDWHFLRDDINSDEPMTVINGRLAKFKIGACEFRDSYNLIPVPLARFGDKLSIDYELMEASRRCDPNVMTEIKRYHRQDCVSLWEKIARYFEDYGKSLTQAGSAIRNWSAMSGIDIPHQSWSAFQRYKPFYYGGRVQCWEEGSKRTDFVTIDKNGAYPAAMKYKHPYSTDATLLDRLPARDSKLSQCLVEFSGTSRGALPWRDEETGSLYFPDDEAGNRNRERVYRVTGWELIAALEYDAVKINHVREVHYFPLTVDFAEYIDFHYERRKQAKALGDVVGDQFAKLFSNSCYGRFGIDPSKQCDYVIASSDSITHWRQQGYVPYKEWGMRWLMVRQPTEDDLLYSERRKCVNVATASSVTGFQRAEMFRGLMQVSGPIYGDTDSLMARSTGKLKLGSELGEWKLEQESDFYAMAGKKTYATHKKGTPWTEEKEDEKKGGYKYFKVACKGADLSPFDIIKVANGETIEYKPRVPTFSITHETPRFINRNILNTYKDISLVA